MGLFCSPLNIYLTARRKCNFNYLVGLPMTTASVLTGFARLLQTNIREKVKKAQKSEDNSISEDMDHALVMGLYLRYLFRYIIDLILIKYQHLILSFYNFINC